MDNTPIRKIIIFQLKAIDVLTSMPKGRNKLLYLRR